MNLTRFIIKVKYKYKILHISALTRKNIVKIVVGSFLTDFININDKSSMIKMDETTAKEISIAY
jgi:hypothetical protein